MTIQKRAIVLLSVLAFTALYVYFSKKESTSIVSTSESLQSQLILKKIPSFTAFTLSGPAIDSLTFKSSTKAYYVHIWGTWCGPCETEFGVLLDFARKFESSEVKFYLIAVNDEVHKVNKFLKKHNIPTNVTVLIDKNNQVMTMFGTYKVPETFLFNRLDQTLNKYSGPQEWMQSIYTDHLMDFLKFN